MYCPDCGQPVNAESHFCEQCGAPLQASERRAAPPMRLHADVPEPYEQASSVRMRNRMQDPYKDQIAQLRLQIKQLKLDLKHITTNMSNTRAQYNQTATFVPRGLLRHGYKMIEDFRLLGPQQQKQQLQQEILNLEQELLGLQQAQAQWKAQRY